MAKKIRDIFKTIPGVLLGAMAIFVSIGQYRISVIQTELATKQFKNNSTFSYNQLRLYEKQNKLIAEQTKTAKQQSNKSLDVTMAQSKTAALKIELISIGTYKEREDELHFINIGETEIKNIEVYAIIDRNYQNHGMTSEISYPKKIVKDNLQEDKDFMMPLSLLPMDKYPRPKVGTHDIFDVIIKYHRAADMKSFSKIFCFFKTDDPARTGKCVYLPIYQDYSGFMLNREDRKSVKYLRDISAKYLRSAEME